MSFDRDRINGFILVLVRPTQMHTNPTRNLKPMKISLNLALALLLCLQLSRGQNALPVLLSNLNASSSCPELEGAWAYDLADHKGLWFHSGDRYLWVLVPKQELEFTHDTLSASQKAALFEGLNISSGKVYCDDSGGTIQHQFIKDPGASGSRFSFDFERSGDRLKYWILDENGSRDIEGQAHKLAGRNDTNPEGCSSINGFWRYDLPEQDGYAVVFGHYFGWILVANDYWTGAPNLESSMGKALGYDNIIAAAGRVSCDGDGKYTWHIEYAKNPESEGTSFSTQNYQEGNSMQYWFFDELGNRIEPPGRTVRVE